MTCYQLRDAKADSNISNRSLHSTKGEEAIACYAFQPEKRGIISSMDAEENRAKLE